MLSCLYAAVRVTRVTVLTGCVLAVPDPARGQMPDLRPVDPARNPPSLSERATGAEAAIPIAVQRSIEGDPELAPYAIKVAGNERRGITLSGNVPSDRLRDRAQHLAESVSGAQHVHNNILVTSRPSVHRGTDAATTDASDPLRVEPQRE